jgi:RsiW-degrading membrane proteinase PrsW (M82 family)
MQVVLTLVAAAAPSLFLLTFFYLKDRYEREPLLHILMAFGLGLYAMIAAQGMASTAEGWISADWLRMGGEPTKLLDAFLLSGFIEETAKWVVLVTAVYHWDEFDEPLDGVVYGVAVALGFATLENLLFVARLGLGVAWQRALFAVPAHALFGATMGYYVGRAKFDRGGALWRDRALCIAVPSVFHGLYDYALAHGLGLRIWILITLLSAALWVFVLRRVHRAQHASPFRPNRTIPPPPPPQPPSQPRASSG